MGRLRDDYENPLHRCIAEEVIDLFGVDDVFLFRWEAADNISIKDPLWDEPTTTVAFKKFVIKASYQDNGSGTDNATESGREMETEIQIFISLNHLTKAQVPTDRFGDWLVDGDVVGLHYRGEYTEFDLLEVQRDGFVNDSDKFTGYACQGKRREKYVADRKTSDG